MKSLRFLLALAFLTYCSPALAIDLEEAQWKIGMYGRSTDDTFSSSKMIGVAGIVNLHGDLADDLEARFLGGVVLQTGSSSSLFTDEFAPKNTLLLQEASIRWHILKPLSVVAGALDQRHQESPLVIDYTTFPAIMGALDFGPGIWVFHGDAQAAIPTSRTLSVRASAGKEATPLVFTEKVIFGIDDRRNEFKALFRATHFAFQNLTSGIAQDSRFYGNTVPGVGAASQFAYQFEGIEAGPDFVIPLGPHFSWSLGASYVQNFQAPTGDDTGKFAYTSLTIRQPTVNITPGFEYYRNEGDSSPGFFNSPDFGHNNRQGIGLTARVELIKSGLTLQVKARRSNMIDVNPFQKDRFDYIQFSLETPYANF